MRIAQIAPLAERVPPLLYGGTERIVSYLTEELVRMGHDVTLFASGDSTTDAALVPGCTTALRLDRRGHDPIPHYMLHLESVRRRAAEFDILHFHIDLLHFPVVREFAGRTLTTLHGRLDLPDLPPVYATFDDLPLASISMAQRLPLPAVAWAGMIHHGLPPGLLPFREAPTGGYLAFLGRISPEKRPDRAIEIARRAGLPLVIAAKVDAADQAYWDEVIEPLVRANPHVTYIGEIGETEKAAFLGDALALLFPIDWPEPFGLVMIEAMSCGTPVVAFRCGSVPEIIDEGVTGFVVDTVDAAVAAVARVGRLDRTLIRRQFERRFTVGRMAADYVSLYESLVNRRAAGIAIPTVPALPRRRPVPYGIGLART